MIPGHHQICFLTSKLLITNFPYSHSSLTSVSLPRLLLSPSTLSSKPHLSLSYSCPYTLSHYLDCSFKETSLLYLPHSSPSCWFTSTSLLIHQVPVSIPPSQSLSSSCPILTRPHDPIYSFTPLSCFVYIQVTEPPSPKCCLHPSRNINESIGNSFPALTANVWTHPKAAEKQQQANSISVPEAGTCSAALGDDLPTVQSALGV